MALLYVKLYGDYLSTCSPLFFDLSFSQIGAVCILSLAEEE